MGNPTPPHKAEAHTTPDTADEENRWMLLASFIDMVVFFGGGGCVNSVRVNDYVTIHDSDAVLIPI